MKNKEKFKDEILEIAAEGSTLGLKDGKPHACEDLESCICCDFKNTGVCDGLRRRWLESEYIEPKEVNWSKVPVDTPIYVRDHEENVWCRAHFAEFKNGEIFTWKYGMTSWSSKELYYSTDSWRFAKLEEPQEENGFYKSRIDEIFERQREKGRYVYGHHLEEDESSTKDRIVMIEEELVDALMYLEHLKEALNDGGI